MSRGTSVVGGEEQYDYVSEGIPSSHTVAGWTTSLLFSNDPRKIPLGRVLKVSLGEVLY